MNTITKSALVVSITLSMTANVWANEASAEGPATDGWTIIQSNEAGETTAIAAHFADAPGLFATCQKNSLVMGISTEAVDMATTLKETTKRSRVYNASLKINGSDETSKPWTYLPSLKIAYPGDAVTSKRLYNAAVRGDVATVKLTGKPEIDYAYPPVNDAFKAFANDCSVTNPSKE